MDDYLNGLVYSFFA